MNHWEKIVRGINPNEDDIEEEITDPKCGLLISSGWQHAKALKALRKTTKSGQRQLIITFEIDGGAYRRRLIEAIIFFDHSNSKIVSRGKEQIDKIKNITGVNNADELKGKFLEIKIGRYVQHNGEIINTINDFR